MVKKTLAIIISTIIVISLVSVILQPIYMNIKILIIFFFVAILETATYVTKNYKQLDKKEYKPDFSSMKSDCDKIFGFKVLK